jgi:lipid-binding SYLF domain-containing protein
MDRETSLMLQRNVKQTFRHRLAVFTMLTASLLVASPQVTLADSEKAETVDQGAANMEAAAQNAAAMVQDATATLASMLERPRFARVMKSAKGLIIFPSLLKAGYFVGGKSGSGILVLKNNDGTWTYPAFYQVTGGSFGLQIGASISQVVIAMMTDKAVSAAIDGNIELGGEIGVAIGPAAVDAGIDTNFDMLTFTISNGLFAGVALDGSTITKSTRRNQAFYSPQTSTKDILVEQTAHNPLASGLLDVLARASATGG